MSAIGVTALGLDAGEPRALARRGRSAGAGPETGRLRLTRRGRAVVAVLALLAAVLVAVLAPGVVQRATADSPSAPVAVEIYTVAAGDTLWGVAAGVTPAGGDVRDAIDDILELNGLASVELEAGQQLMLPLVDELVG
ncbi:MAG: LysM peptidoglycan-binding domain-containing protein [Cellulomonadaceae bacterium]